MRLNKLFFLAPIAVLSLTSCGKQVRYSEDKYVLNYNQAANAIKDYKDEDFNILQISDIHFTYLADNQYHFKFIEKTINAAKEALRQDGKKLHLIAITGDTFTFATKETIKECCSFFEKQKTPWTITFGNHDEQGYFSVDWMTGYLNSLSKKKGSNLLFKDLQNDDVFGSANFAINLRDSEVSSGDTRQIMIMDSNRYNYGEGMGYDYIHADQIDWYERMYHYFVRSGISKPESVAFFHIPLVEFTDAYKQGNFKESTVYDGVGQPVKTNFKRDGRGEDESSPLVNTHFLDRIEKCEWYTKGIFVGHDHINNYCVEYFPIDGSENKIIFGYGVKATNTVYYDDAYLGGQIIKFHNNGTLDTDLVLHTYKDLEVK